VIYASLIKGNPTYERDKVRMSADYVIGVLHGSMIGEEVSGLEMPRGYSDELHARGAIL
jgi:hypothetical protein